MIEREKLEKLARVMGGEFFPFTHPGWDCAVWHQDHGEVGKRFAMYKAAADGTYEPGTLESLEQKVDEWVAEANGRRWSAAYYDGLHRVTIASPVAKTQQFTGTRLSTLIDAVLWIAEQEREPAPTSDTAATGS